MIINNYFLLILFIISLLLHQWTEDDIKEYRYYKYKFIVKIYKKIKAGKAGLQIIMLFSGMLIIWSGIEFNASVYGLNTVLASIGIMIGILNGIFILKKNKEEEESKDKTNKSLWDDGYIDRI